MRNRRLIPFVILVLLSGLSLSSCRSVDNYAFRVKNSTKDTVPNAVYNDTAICQGATTIGRGGWAIWDTAPVSSWALKEARRRNLPLRRCAALAGRNFKNEYLVAQEKEEKKRAEAKAEERRRTRLAEERRVRIAQEERERKLENDRQQRAEAERQRIAKIELVKKRKSDERKQRELVRKRKLAEVHDKEIAPLRKRNKHSVAVIIGNKNYAGRIPAVDYAHNDAGAMRRFVINKLGYRDGNIIDLRDAGRNRIAAVFGNEKTHEGELFNIIREGKSDVTVYYSGHGVPGLKDKRPYLLPVNGNPDLAEITGYSVDTLYANLAKLPARSVTVFLDACFSGDSEKGMLVSSASGLGLEQDIPAASGRLTVITAAQGNQLASWDPKARHGLFTRHLLDALNGKADNKEYGNADGEVSLAEVQNYLADEMTYQARRTWNRRQNAYVSGNGKAVLSTVLPTQ
jgi:hypothetical protein